MGQPVRVRVSPFALAHPVEGKRMEVSIQNTGELERRLKVTLAVEEVERSFNERLQKLRKKIRISGFRPGKVPIKLLRDLHGQELYQEVVTGMIDQAYTDVIKQYKIEVVTSPYFEDIRMAMGEDVKFVARVEVFPEFEPKLLEGVEIEQPHVEISKQDVEDFLLKIRRQYGEWLPTERAVQDGDRIQIKMHSERIAAKFHKKKDETLTLMVDAKKPEENIGQHLIGSKKGERVTVKMPVPDLTENGFRKLLNRIHLFTGPKSEVFDVTIEEVMESKLAEMNLEFFKKFGLERREAKKLREILHKSIEQRVKKNIEKRVRQAIFNALIERNTFTIPQMMVNNEVRSLREKMVTTMSLDKESAAKIEDSVFEKQAEQNVKSFLVVDRIAKRYRISVDNNAFEEKLGEIAADFENPTEAKDYYRRDQEARYSLWLMALQDMVFQYVLQTATLRTKEYTFSEIAET